MDGIIKTLDPARVKPFADNPRKRFRGIKQLANSIRAVGQTTPILVTDCAEDGYDAELVDGERRLQACLLGHMPIKAIFERNGQAADRFVRSVAANFCRQSHDAVEILEAVVTLKGSGKTTDQIAAILGKTPSWVAQYLQLRKLAPEVLEELKVPGDDAAKGRAHRRRRGKMTLSLAMLLAPLPSDVQIEAMRTIAAKRLSLTAARTYVHRLAGKRGTPVGKRLSDYQRLKALANAVENCWQVVERHLRMPGIEIQTLVRGATRQERREMAAKLESLCEGLLMLSDALEK